MSDVDFDNYIDPDKVYDAEAPEYVYRDDKRIVEFDDDELDGGL